MHHAAQKCAGGADSIAEPSIRDKQSKGLVVAHGSGCDLQVTRGGGQAAMTQQELNSTTIGAGFQQVRGERVT